VCTLAQNERQTNGGPCAEFIKARTKKVAIEEHDNEETLNTHLCAQPRARVGRRACIKTMTTSKVSHGAQQCYCRWFQSISAARKWTSTARYNSATRR